MFLIKFSNRIVEYSFYLLFFLVPLFMTPFNFELFEFNKMMLVYTLTIVIAASWLTKMVAVRQVIFRRTPLDIPILFFLISQFLSFLFSIDRHTSLWGYYGRFNGGFLSTLSYITLYYAFVSNSTGIFAISCLRISLLSGFLVAAYGILERFGIDAQYWVQDVKARVFSTIGQPNWLAAYLVALSPLAWAFALNPKHKVSKFKKERNNVKLLSFIFYLLSSIFYLCLLFTRSRSGFLGFGVAYLAFWAFVFLKKRKEVLKPFLLFTFYFLLFTFFVGTPFEKINQYGTARGLVEIMRDDKGLVGDKEEARLVLEPGGTESGEIRKIVWRGAVDVWRHYPLFGSGVETFAYSYYQFRPKEHNLTSEWDFLYNKAHNEYLNFLATAGVVGLGAYLFFIGSFVWWNIRKLKCQSSNVKSNPKLKAQIRILDFRLDLNLWILSLGLFSGWLSILITNFFGFSVVPVAIFFFLIPAMSFTLVTQPEKLTNQPFSHLTIRQLRISQKFLIFIVLSFIFYLLSFIFKLWLADVAYARGQNFERSGQYDRALIFLERANRLNPAEPVYLNEEAILLANLAVSAYEQNSDPLAQSLAQKAISFSNLAIEISPYNLNFWKDRAKLFYRLSLIDPEYLERSLAALVSAHVLAPTDAKIAYNLGLVLAQLGREEQAIRTLEETVNLKPDYRQARYALALFYHQAEMDEKAVGELEYILEKIATDDVEAREKLEEWENEQ